jgi:hypothetical protein
VDGMRVKGRWKTSRIVGCCCICCCGYYSSSDISTGDGGMTGVRLSRTTGSHFMGDGGEGNTHGTRPFIILGHSHPPPVTIKL